MRASILDLFPDFYDEAQIASAAVHIGHLDLMLIADGTYFVHDADDEIVGVRRMEQARQALCRRRRSTGR